MSTPCSRAASKLSNVFPGATWSAPLWPTRFTTGSRDTSSRPRASSAQGQPSRPLPEAELDQEGADRGADHGLTVEALDPEARHTAPPDLVGERLERRPEPVLVRLAQWQQALPAPLGVEHRLRVEHDDVRARHAGGAATLVALATRPRQGGPVGVCRVRGGEHECAALLVAAHRPQALDGRRKCELSTAEALDEVPAT